MVERKGVMVTDSLEEEVAPEEVEIPPKPAPPTAPPVIEDDEDNDPDVEVVPGGPTWGQIDVWKKEFGDIYITSFTPESHAVWRTLTRFEYKRLVKNMEMSISTGQVTQSDANFNNEEAMCEMCVLYPKVSKVEMSGDLAGKASILSQEIMEASGFVALDVRQL